VTGVVCSLNLNGMFICELCCEFYRWGLCLRSLKVESQLLSSRIVMCLKKTGESVFGCSGLLLLVCYLFCYWGNVVACKCRYGNATVVENTERGWRDLIFKRIRAMFGFGIWGFLDTVCVVEFLFFLSRDFCFLFTFQQGRLLDWPLQKTKCLLFNWMIFLVVSFNIKMGFAIIHQS